MLRAPVFCSVVKWDAGGDDVILALLGARYSLCEHDLPYYGHGDGRMWILCKNVLRPHSMYF